MTSEKAKGQKASQLQPEELTFGNQAAADTKKGRLYGRSLKRRQLETGRIDSFQEV